MTFLDLHSLPLWAHVAGIATGASGVWYGGTKLALYGDEIAERTGWGRAFVGLVLLAALTELPELVTTAGAAAVGDAPMAVNNLFGGIALQTAILVAADLSLAKGPLTFFVPRPDLIMQGLSLLLLLALTLAVILLGEPVVALGVGAGTAGLFAAYVALLWMLRRYKGNRSWRPVDVPDELREQSVDRQRSRRERPTPELVGRFASAGLLVLVSGSLVILFAETIAERTGLGSSFVGATLVAATTSLPELSTTLGAVRLGAYSMAIANVFGSNAIMIALLFVADVAFRSGPLLDNVDDSALFSAVAGIAVTTVYLMGLVERRDRAVLRLGLDSWVVLALYAATLVGLYALRH